MNGTVLLVIGTIVSAIMATLIFVGLYRWFLVARVKKLRKIYPGAIVVDAGRAPAMASALRPVAREFGWNEPEEPLSPGLTVVVDNSEISIWTILGRIAHVGLESIKSFDFAEIQQRTTSARGFIIRGESNSGGEFDIPVVVYGAGLLGAFSPSRGRLDVLLVSLNAKVPKSSHRDEQA